MLCQDQTYVARDVQIMKVVEYNKFLLSKLYYVYSFTCFAGVANIWCPFSKPVLSYIAKYNKAAIASRRQFIFTFTDLESNQFY